MSPSSSVVATFMDSAGNPSIMRGEPDKIVFETAPETFGKLLSLPLVIIFFVVKPFLLLFVV